MHELLKRLIEERARVWEQAKTVLDKADEEKRDLSAEEQQEFARLEADLNDKDERIEQLRERMDREEQANEARGRVEHILRPHDEARDKGTQTLDDQVLSWARGQGAKHIEVPITQLRATRRSDTGLWEVRDLTEERNLVKGTAAAGGNLVPTSFRAQLYEHLIENSAIRQTRAEVITTSSGEDLVLPKTTAHPAAGTIVSEAAAIGVNEPTFGQGTLHAYKFASLVQVSTELIQDSAVDLLGYLARAFGTALGNGAGGKFVTGTGSSEPQGVVTAGSVMVTGGTPAANGPTADELIDLFFTVKEPYARNGEWFLRRATLGKVRKLKDSYGQYLWQPGLAADAQSTILGRPYVLDPNVPAAAANATIVGFGDFSTYKIRDVGSIRFERSDDYAFANDLVTFRAILRTDGALLDTTGSIGWYKAGTA